MNAQYKKGVLDLCVLSLLHKRDCYGCEISDFLSRHIDIADGTVYPILRKLKGAACSRPKRRSPRSSALRRNWPCSLATCRRRTPAIRRR